VRLDSLVLEGSLARLVLPALAVVQVSRVLKALQDQLVFRAV